MEKIRKPIFETITTWLKTGKPEEPVLAQEPARVRVADNGFLMGSAQLKNIRGDTENYLLNSYLQILDNLRKDVIVQQLSGQILKPVYSEKGGFQGENGMISEWQFKNSKIEATAWPADNNGGIVISSRATAIRSVKQLIVATTKATEIEWLHFSCDNLMLPQNKFSYKPDDFYGRLIGTIMFNHFTSENAAYGLQPDKILINGSCEFGESGAKISAIIFEIGSLSQEELQTMPFDQAFHNVLYENSDYSSPQK